MVAVTPAEAVLAAVATNRLVQLWQTDEITHTARQTVARRYPPRMWLLDPGEQPAGPRFTDPTRRGWEQVHTSPDDLNPRWFHRKGTLIGRALECPVCLTVHAAYITLIATRPRRVTHPSRLAADTLTVAGLAPIITTIVRTIGDKARNGTPPLIP